MAQEFLNLAQRCKEHYVTGIVTIQLIHGNLLESCGNVALASISDDNRLIDYSQKGCRP